MNSTMQVLLTGAAGTIGYEVIKRLVHDTGIRLTLFELENKRTRKLLSPFRQQANIIYGDLSRTEDVSRIPPGLDAVIHLAALIPPQADISPELTSKVNVTGTKTLVDYLETTSPHVFVLYSSSVAIYGDRLLTPFIKATDPIQHLEDVYARTKAEAEQYLCHSQLSWTVFRLAAIMKNHKMSGLMFQMPLSTKLEIATAEDTAQAFIKGIRKKNELEGRIFNLGGGELCQTTYREFIERSFRLYGLGKLNFPEYAFAGQNFHCGWMVDGDELENILHFRNATLDSYFTGTKRRIPFYVRLAGTLFRVLVKRSLLSQSEPYRAYRTRDKSQLERFFGHEEILQMYFNAQ